MDKQELLPHLFRTEFRKIAAVLCKRLGIEHLEIAEDIASETFLSALEAWPFRGVPENPVAWLYTVAKNKARNHITRNNLLEEKVSVQWQEQTPRTYEPDIDLSEENIIDSQLQMLFAICNPLLAPEAQIGLALRILCGFGIDEIATAFLSNKETINKRLFRAREKLRTEKVKIEFPSALEIGKRLDTVLTTLYLLFNEGYCSESQDTVLREDLCAEAMRLVHLLLDNPQTNLPRVHALYALMCFHASRFAARKSDSGQVILYHDQDETLWDQTFITRGAYHLHQASQGTILSRYHLEACIAYWHTIKQDTHMKWENILQLYNQLLKMEYSPIAALNRTYALYKANGLDEAIVEAEKLQLTDNHYYYTLLGELYAGMDKERAIMHYQRALALARSNPDKNILQQKISALKNSSMKAGA